MAVVYKKRGKSDNFLTSSTAYTVHTQTQYNNLMYFRLNVNECDLYMYGWSDGAW